MMILLSFLLALAGAAFFLPGDDRVAAVCFAASWIILVVRLTLRLSNPMRQFLLSRNAYLERELAKEQEISKRLRNELDGEAAK